MVGYLFAFAIDLAASIYRIRPMSGGHAAREMVAIAQDIATTDCGPLECLTLMNIAGFESVWDRSAVGRHGELGAFQIWVFDGTSVAQRAEWRARGAREALRRMRVQGMLGYCGCSRATPECDAMVEHRTFPAKIYFWSHAPPGAA
jgi:hypothetical protein